VRKDGFLTWRESPDRLGWTVFLTGKNFKKFHFSGPPWAKSQHLREKKRGGGEIFPLLSVSRPPERPATRERERGAKIALYASMPTPCAIKSHKVFTHHQSLTPSPRVYGVPPLRDGHGVSRLTESRPRSIRCHKPPKVSHLTERPLWSHYARTRLCGLYGSRTRIKSHTRIIRA